MTEQDGDVTVWLQDLKQGSPDAAAQIWQHFYERLVRYTDRKLGGLPRRDADEEDVALSAMHDLHRGIQSGRFPELENRDDLWKILLTIASRKAGKRIRHLLADKRGGGQIRGESIFGDPMLNQGGLHQFAGKTTPAAVAEELSAECQELLDQLDDDVLRKIGVMKLQGFTNEEIARELGCVVRSVERKLNRIRAIWES
jgi:DNA-directed RNA polymerase specialized sigma24 family protein